MNKSELFKKAHELARTFTGDYSARFALAITELTGKVKAGYEYQAGKETIKVITQNKLLSKKEVAQIIEVIQSEVTDEVEDRLYNENPANFKQAIVDLKLGLIFKLAPNSRQGYYEYSKRFERELDLTGYQREVFRFFNK